MGQPRPHPEFRLDACPGGQTIGISRKAGGPLQTDPKNAEQESDNTTNTEPVAHVRLIRKLTPGDEGSLIVKGDSISIRLNQASIADFWETGFFSPHRGFRSNGEIAIVVNVFEFSPDDAGKDFNFTPEGLKRGRLVFFSNDVEEGCLLTILI